MIIIRINQNIQTIMSKLSFTSAIKKIINSYNERVEQKKNLILICPLIFTSKVLLLFLQGLLPFLGNLVHVSLYLHLNLCFHPHLNLHLHIDLLLNCLMTSTHHHLQLQILYQSNNEPFIYLLDNITSYTRDIIVCVVSVTL